MENSKKVQGRGTAIKHSNPNTIVASVKKNKDGKFGSVTLKKPFALATNRRSPNDRQIAESITSIPSVRAKKLASAASAACHFPVNASNMIVYEYIGFKVKNHSFLFSYALC